MSALLAIALVAVLTPQASPDPYANETAAQRDARMKWFREARFGMFIHWGVYSVPAGVYDGKPIGGIGEWIMHQARIPVDRYRAYAKEFNPTRYDAEKWVRIAKDTGMKYIVITSKHHDGFAMFDSKASDWNIVKATPFGRDPLQELAAACHREGIRLGFYYSQAQDWNNGGSAAGGHWDPKQDRDMTEYIQKVAVPQVKETLTHYGKISVLWWDTPYEMTKERADLLLPLLKLQPGIITNNRLGGGYMGDTETPEQFVPATGYPGRDWETCMTMNDTWGFKSTDHNWKSSETLIRTLIDIASKGGNFLLNVGPTSLGEIPAPSVERLAAVGAWMKQNGSAIYATTASPFKKLSWGRCTKVLGKDGAALYLHVFDWPTNGKLLVPGLRSPVGGASLLVGGTKLACRNTAEGVEVDVPAQAPDKVSTTIQLMVKGALVVEQPELVLKLEGTLALSPDDATLHGGLQSEQRGGKPNLGFWTDPKDTAEWTFTAPRAGNVAATTEIAAPASAAFEVTLGGKTVRFDSPATGSYDTYQTVNLGTFPVVAGKNTLVVRPVAQGWKPMNLRAIQLKIMPACPTPR
ncbi:MAG: alpha-L-fucosidase [Chthonomonadaceae bacterium]|nr:alpha-L-fucosidase [Chthonomonadaceae bacterium]